MSKTFKKNIFDKEILKKLKKWHEFIESRVGESKYEKALFTKFQKGVEEHFKDPNVPRKFHLEHIYNLNIDWDILFLYSKKDVGKTWQIVEYINRERNLYPDMQVVYIRNTKEETKVLNTQFDEPRWPFYMRNEKLYWKNPKFPNRRSFKDKQAGLVSYTGGSSGFRKWQGADHPNVRVVVWDECNSLAGGLTPSVIRDFQIFTSSIIRDKKGVKIFMFGNHLRANNIFLNALHVTSETKLKVIKSADGLSTLLYLNTGDMYEGIEKQVGLPTQFGSVNDSADLFTNRPKYRGTKNIYDEQYFFKVLKPVRAIVFTSKRFPEKDIKVRYLIMYLSKDPLEEGKYGMWLEEYTDDTFKWEINPTIPEHGRFMPIGFEPTVLNVFQYVKRVEEDIVGSIFRSIKRLNERGRIWYGTNNTFAMWESIFSDIENIAKRTDPEKNKKQI